MLVALLDHMYHRWPPVRCPRRLFFLLWLFLLKLFLLIHLLLLILLVLIPLVGQAAWLLLLVGQPLLLFLVLWFLLRFLLILLLPTLEAEGARNKCATIWQRDATITKCWIVVMDYAVLVARRS